MILTRRELTEGPMRAYGPLFFFLIFKVRHILAWPLLRFLGSLHLHILTCYWIGIEFFLPNNSFVALWSSCKFCSSNPATASKVENYRAIFATALQLGQTNWRPGTDLRMFQPPTFRFHLKLSAKKSQLLVKKKKSQLRCQRPIQIRDRIYTAVSN